MVRVNQFIINLLSRSLPSMEIYRGINCVVFINYPLTSFGLLQLYLYSIYFFKNVHSYKAGFSSFTRVFL